MFRKILVGLVFLSAIFANGCNEISPVGPIMSLGIMWYQGEAQKYYATPQEQIHYAIKDVLKEFTLPILEEKIENDTIYIKAGDDDRFKIKIISVRENVTKLAIRINVMGDKPYAEMIFRHVDKRSGVEQFVSLKHLNSEVEKQPRRIRNRRF